MSAYYVVAPGDAPYDGLYVCANHLELIDVEGATITEDSNPKEPCCFNDAAFETKKITGNKLYAKCYYNQHDQHEMGSQFAHADRTGRV